MTKKPIILGIESSCDETAVAVIQENKQDTPQILSSIVSSQVDIHKEFGGVVPELAARSHVEKIDLIAKKAIDESGIKLEDVDAVAATAGPGLIVCLSVGLSFGKAMAASLNKPFIAVNHLEGHALSPKLNSKINYPYLLLLISGGHTQFLCVKALGKYKRLGTTIDDAVGEAFDKTAKLIGIEFPGGPKIEEYAKLGNPNKFKLPKPIINKGGCNLSFAGLKTAVLKIATNLKTKQEKFDLAASFQKTIEEILYEKSKIAFDEFRKRFDLSREVLSGLGIEENDYEVGIRFTEDFYNENKDLIKQLVSKVGKPVLVEMWKEKFFYFVLKWEFNFIDNLGKASALSTDQIDVENGKRYGITFTDEKNEQQHPIILHNSPSGAVERVIYALLEKSAMQIKDGKIPQFPLWLAPTQVRLIPLKDDFLEFASNLASKLTEQNIRVDIDDRNDTIGKRIRDAEKEWISYVLVIGEKEMNSPSLSVRDRTTGDVRQLSTEDFVKEIQNATSGKPISKLNSAVLLSQRPQIMV